MDDSLAGDGEGPRVRLLEEGSRGTLTWDQARPPLARESELLDRRLSREPPSGTLPSHQVEFAHRKLGGFLREHREELGECR